MSVKFTCNSSIMTDEKLSRSAKWLYVVISYLYSKYGFTDEREIKILLELLDKAE